MSIAEQDPNAAKVARETAGTDVPRRWLGKSLNRVEDPRFLRGQGRYLDDIKLPGMLHAAVLRSPHAHARIVSVDTSKAEALPGVVRVVTGKDVAAHAAPAALVRRRPDRAGHDRDREGTPLRRDGGGCDRRQPLHRRGRAAT